MKAIMYHYVRRENKELPFFRYLHVDNFIQQLDWFQKEHTILALEEFMRVINGVESMPEEGVVLTFDDGFIDHYDYVMPELLKRGIFGIFYIPTYMYTRRPDLLDVHKIHYLTGRVKADILFDQLGDALTEDMLPGQRIKEFRENTYKKHDDGEKIKLFKRTFNYFLSYDVRTAILDKLLAQNGLKPDPASFYLNRSHIKEMHDKGMVIGSHSVTHPVFSNISLEQQNIEIKESFEFIADAVGGNLILKTFCYPYGGFHSFTPQTEKILADHDVRFSFNVESRDISANDFSHRPQALPRYDCNEFPYGMAS